MKKIIWISAILLIVALGIIVGWRYFFVFSEGVKSGDLNYFEKKGVFFKTYEGRIVQAGFQSPTAGALQSNEFRFSVVEDSVAQTLDRASGQFVELRYVQYIRPVPWRGASEYVVTEVLQTDEPRRDKMCLLIKEATADVLQTRPSECIYTKTEASQYVPSTIIAK